jgi:PAS domain S-box-containing protein
MTAAADQPVPEARLRVLLVDDDAVDRLAVGRCLRQSGLPAEVDEADSAAQALARIGHAAYDCVVLDYYLPDADGAALLGRVKDAAPHVPVVILTGRGDEEVAVELMKAGAVDYLPKASLTPERLCASLRLAKQLAEAAAARQRAEQELREQEARFRTLANAIPQLAWMADADGERTWFNQRWLDYTGTTPDEVRGSGWQRVHHPDHVQRVVVNVRRSVETGEPWEDTVPLRGKDGSYRWFLTRMVPTRDADGGVVSWLGTNTDITERLAAEKALRESEERLRRALEIETVGVLFFTVDGQITHANDAFLRMAGYGRDDVAAGRVRWDELTPPEWMPQSRRAVEEFLATGRTTPYEKQYLRKDGSRWWALFAATRLNEREGVEFVLDITAQKRADAERLALLERERVARADAEAAIRARDEFVAVVAHDLGNPLTAVSGQVQMIRRRLRRGDVLPTEDLLSRLDTIEASLKGLSTVIDELRDATLVQAGRSLELRARPTDLVALAREAVARSESASESHQILTLCAEPCLVGVWDADRLQRVVGNLLSNAVKFSPGGGQITVEVRRDEGQAVLAVHDQGIGIPADDLPRVFERYQRASNVAGRIAGSGLGLAGAKEIVERHGGSILVQSAEGHGSTFTVRLPLPDDGPASAPTPPGQ